MRARPRIAIFASLLPCLWAFAASAGSDSPIAMKPAKITPGIANESCASSPFAHTFAVGGDAAAYFTTCLVEPGFPTSLHYMRLGAPERVIALQIATDPPPAMLGFDRSDRVLWASTLGGDKRAGRRLGIHRFDPSNLSTTVVAGVELPSPSVVLAALPGTGCWLVRMVGRGTEQWAIVAANGEKASLTPSVPGERPLFWDSAAAKFVVVADGAMNAEPAFSSLDCAGSRAAVRPALEAFLRRFYSRFNTYYAAAGGEIALIGLGTDVAGRLSRSNAAFDLAADREADAEKLLGSAAARVRAVAAGAGGRYAIATDEALRVFERGAAAKNLPAPRGRAAGIGFAGKNAALVVPAGFGINVYRMEED